MKCKVLPFVIAALAPLMVQAEQTSFVGIGYGMPSMTVKFESRGYLNDISSSEKMNKDKQGFSGRYGVYQENARYYGQLDYATATAKDFDKDVTYTGLSANVDYVYRPSQTLGLFVGPHIQVGYADFYETREKGGIGMGLQLGGLAQFDNGFELELGYRHTKTTIKADAMHQGLSGFALEDIAGIYATANYRF